ncbi:guanylate cyclase [Plakobranchus ocellatus]|uniref:Guanylate cyclase n=1 Tax=Plakobranchus ocellatus TaxID=259542 RepID=A0AAV4AJV1_9GAST|nr:guanylate cyclase [Plakobranchus ocellatus]
MHTLHTQAYAQPVCFAVNQRVGTYMAQEGRLNLNPGVAISWPGGYGPAPDIPQCGFRDLLCNEYDDEEDLESTNLAIGLSTSMSIVLIAAALGVSILLKYKAAQRRRQLSWWKIDIDDLQPMKRNLTKSTFSSVLRQGNLVRQHSITGGHFPVNAKILREFEEIRDLNHPNLLRVVGAVLEGDKKVLVTEHCPKGSLQEGQYEGYEKVYNRQICPLSMRSEFPVRSPDVSTNMRSASAKD